MIRILLLLAVLGLSACATARPRVAQPHPDETAILTVVDRFMHAISANDAALLSEIRLEGGFTIVERPNESGGTLVTRRVFNPEGGRRGAYRERYWDPTVLVRGSLAVVWTPYRVLDRRQDEPLRHRRVRHAQGARRLADCQCHVDRRARCVRGAPSRRSLAPAAAMTAASPAPPDLLSPESPDLRGLTAGAVRCI